MQEEAGKDVGRNRKCRKQKPETPQAEEQEQRRIPGFRPRPATAHQNICLAFISRYLLIRSIERLSGVVSSAQMPCC